MNFAGAFAVAFASFDSLDELESGIVPEGTMMMNELHFVCQIDDEHIPSPMNRENIDDEHLLK
jgi:hypothetical protein